MSGRLHAAFVPWAVLVACGGAAGTSGGDVVTPADPGPDAAPAFRIRTVFLIVLENHDWKDLEGSPDAPYLNGTLLREGAHATRYRSPPGVAPSEPNYLWLEAGTDFGIRDDADPAANRQSTTDHLVTRLEQAGIAWKSYQFHVDGKTCPLESRNGYWAKHDPFVFFDDVTGGLDPGSPRCIAHVRPYGELAGDLDADRVSGYVFITPDQCHSMHGDPSCPGNPVRQGDDWLASEVPTILASRAYRDGGLLLITFDEPRTPGAPIGLIALSPIARAGYAGDHEYDHGSTLRTVQAVFGVTPFLRDAANREDLSDLLRQQVP